MSTDPVSAGPTRLSAATPGTASLSPGERAGREVLGPVMAEFCLRLWSLSSMLEAPEDTMLLFCARGGLRMQLAYERFLAATALPGRSPVAPLMVSRVVALRGALVRAVNEGRTEPLPATATALHYEFANVSTRVAAESVSGVAPAGTDPRWDARLTAGSLMALLHHEDGAPVIAALRHQEQLFAEHLAARLGGRTRCLLVDTGRFGTTRELIAEGHPELDVGSVLMARSFRPGYPVRGRTVGLLVESQEYVPTRRRSALLRNWHFVEWLFEPSLTTVRTFRREGGGVVSNLEVPGWESMVEGDPGTAFAGLLAYLDQLSPSSADRIASESGRAWSLLHRAIVFPDRDRGEGLSVGLRSHDFGRDESFGARPWDGPIAALRGTTMWREGEIARAGTAWRRPLLAAIESAYGARYVTRMARARLGSGPGPDPEVDQVASTSSE